MGKVMSSAARVTRNYNIENRAQKAIETQMKTPKVAPAYPSTQESLRKIKDEFPPDELDELLTKDAELHDRLKTMYVESQGDPVVIRTKERPLPESRETVEDPIFGYLEPKVIKEGRMSLRQVMEMLSQHQQSPDTYTAAMAAQDYKIDTLHAQQVLKYFSMFELHVPDEYNKEIKEALPPGFIQRALTSREGRES